jgi:probable phosphoglycerate mutase
MQTRIYLARHGETLWNKTQRLQGQLDSELTPLGKTQSLDIAEMLATKNINLIVSSPLGRALQSAVICKQKLNVTHQISNNLMERNLGVWQGEEVKTLQALPEYSELLKQVTSLTVDNSESALTCGHRIFDTLKELGYEHTGQNILIICHGEALRCLLFLLGKTDTSNAFTLYKNGCVVTLDFKPKAPYLTLI